jgi:hypothetical protein
MEFRVALVHNAHSGTAALGEGESMAAAPVEKAKSGDADLVRRWRFEQLMRAGYTIPDALELALRPDIDLHWAASLVRRGCPSSTAARIAL